MLLSRCSLQDPDGLLWKAGISSHLPPVTLHVAVVWVTGFYEFLFVQMLVMYMTAGGACFSGPGLVGTSVYWYLEGLLEVGFRASFSLFFLSKAQKLRPMKSAADTMKKLEA